MARIKKIRRSHSTPQNIAFTLKAIWQYNKVILLYMFLQMACGVLMPALGIYMPKLVIDQITRAVSPIAMVLAIGGMGLFIAALNIVNGFTSGAMKKSSFPFRCNFLFKALYKMMDCDYSFMESAQGQTKIERGLNSLFNDGKGVGVIFIKVGEILSKILGFFLYSSILSTLNPIIMIVMTVTSIAYYFVLKYVTDDFDKNKANWIPIDKKLEYIKNKSADFQNAKDIRLYNMKQWFCDNFDHFFELRMWWHKKMNNRDLISAVADCAIMLVRDGFAYIYLIFAIVNGQITVAEFVLFFGAIAGFSNFVTGIIYDYDKLYHASLDVNDTRDFLEFKDKETPKSSILQNKQNDEKARLKIKTPISIEFKNIFFRYETDAEYILKDFSLSIKAGEKLAIVGTNGAGKTTIVKLLCGFYTPESGDILLNGESIRKYNRDDLYTLFSAVFQDIFIMPMTVAKNIAMSDSFDKEKIEKCIALAGLKDRLPDLEAMLTKVRVEDGIELSGGEQQKLILSRALYKNAPIMLLDEPTAALDPIAESELYIKYNELTKDKTSIFISHRLASTNFCDSIAFIENGAVSEFGTHSELIKNNKGYANMFAVQSKYYSNSSDENFSENSGQENLY